jgi:hypothetical protein
MEQFERFCGGTEDDHENLRLVGVSAVIRATRLPNTSEKRYRLNRMSVALVVCNVRNRLRRPKARLSSQYSRVFVLSDAA